MKLTLSDIDAAIGKYKRGPKPLSDEALVAIRELQAFVVSELGAKATDLLEASGRTINLYNEPKDGGPTTEYNLNGQGLVCVSGFTRAYGDGADKPTVHPITPFVLVTEIAKTSEHFPFASLMQKIEKGLEQAIAAAPK